MKILLIHNFYKKRLIGGEDVAFRQEYSKLKEKLGDNLFLYEVSNDNLNIFYLFFNYLFSFKHYKNVKNIIINNNIDIVHIHNYFPILSYSIFKAAKDSKTIVIHTLHNFRKWCISGILYRNEYGICEICTKQNFPIYGIIHKCYKNSFLLSLLYQFNTWFNNFFNLFNKIDYFFVLTNFQKQKLVEYGISENKLILKPNVLDSNFNNIKFSNEKNGYIYVGKIEESKGIKLLLNIWINLPNEFVLTIIGEGVDYTKLKNIYNRSNIIFTGKKDRDFTLSKIALSKYLIQPSLVFETFGLTILESFNLGTPVIGLNIGTRIDFITDAYNGFICNQKDLEIIIYKSFVYQHYENLVKGALSTSNNFDSDFIINKQIDFYNSLKK
jgi:glycosyltransferase involved in cell wall biosynthesis